MANETKKEPRRLYDLSELEEWIENYREWYNQQQAQTQSSGSNPGGPNPPPPPPGNP